jgi:recombination associated protein RdgC
MKFFSNLSIYRINAAHGFTSESIEALLIKKPFVPCGSMDLEAIGWIPANESMPDSIIYEQQNSVLLALKVEKKIIPPKAVKKEVKAKVKLIESEENRKVGRIEINEIKERIIDEMKPRALTEESIINAVIDFNNNLIYVNQSAASKAEFFLSSLRETLGSLPTRLIDTEMTPTGAMTSWLGTEPPDGFTLGQVAELKVPGDEGSVARFKRQVLDCDEVRQHLSVGKIATLLALNFGERLSFLLTESTQVKSVTLLDVVKDELKDLDAEDRSALFNSQYALLIGELRAFIPALFAALGGERVHEGDAIAPNGV